MTETIEVENRRTLADVVVAVVLLLLAIKTHGVRNDVHWRRLYLEAMKDSKELKDNREEYNWKAILNYLREEIRVADISPEKAISILDEINERPDMKEITKMKEDIKQMVL